MINTKYYKNLLFIIMFVGIVIWFFNHVTISNTNSLTIIQSNIERVECIWKQVGKFRGKIRLHYFNKLKQKRSIEININRITQEIYTNKYDFLDICSKIINKIHQKDPIIITKSGNYILGLKIKNNIFLDSEKEIIEFNKSMKLAIKATMIIGLFLFVIYLLTWQFNVKLENFINSKFFQYILIFIAIMGIIRFLFGI